MGNRIISTTLVIVITATLLLTGVSTIQATTMQATTIQATETEETTSTEITALEGLSDSDTILIRKIQYLVGKLPNNAEEALDIVGLKAYEKAVEEVQLLAYEIMNDEQRNIVLTYVNNNYEKLTIEIDIEMMEREDKELNMMATISFFIIITLVVYAIKYICAVIYM